jgi:hypothetical protein
MAKFEATGQACARVGWEYRLAGTADEIVTANVRWLAGYRRPRCGIPALAGALRAAFAAPAPWTGAGRRVTQSPCCRCSTTCCGGRSWQPTCRCRCTRHDRDPGGGMTAGVSRTVLRPGDWVSFDGGEHQVLAFTGTPVRLRTQDGGEQVLLAPYLMAAPDFAVTGGEAAPGVEPFGLLDSLPTEVLRSTGLGAPRGGGGDWPGTGRLRIRRVTSAGAQGLPVMGVKRTGAGSSAPDTHLGG